MVCENYNCEPPFFTERILQKSAPETQSQDLKKCLNLLDLTVQGLAHIIGAGIFITTPGTIRMIAGPGLTLSYLLAGIALSFTVLCYMDLACRYQGISNAYVYVYASLGELLAGIASIFVLAEIALTGAVVSVGFGENMASFLSSISDNASLLTDFDATMMKAFPSFNVLSVILIVICCLINCIGVKQVAVMNEIIIVFSVLTLFMYCVIALIYGSPTTFAYSTDPETGQGGAFPYGLAGIISGAGVSIVSFAGFETIVTFSAEAANPKRDVPIAVALSFGFSTLLYVCVSAAISYMTPWYEISKSTGIVDTLRPYPELKVPMIIVQIAIFASSASVALCTTTTMARSLMMISLDGLIPSPLAWVVECSKVPVVATLVSTLIIVILTVLFDYDALIYLVSGGILLVFTAVCFAVVVISYKKLLPSVPTETTELLNSEVSDKPVSEPDFVEGQPEKVTIFMGFYTIVMVVGVALLYHPDSLDLWKVRFPLFLLFAAIALAILSYIRWKYVLQQGTVEAFVCPGVPFIPALGMALNIGMFLSLDVSAHIIVLFYLAAGGGLYFVYGYWNSAISVEKQEEIRIHTHELQPYMD